MSIVNSLTFSQNRRDVLVNGKNGFTFIAYITVMIVGFIIFIIDKDPISQFRYFIVTIGLLNVAGSLIFIFSIDEPKLSKLARDLDDDFKKRGAGLLADEYAASGVVDSGALGWRLGSLKMCAVLRLESVEGACFGRVSRTPKSAFAICAAQT